MLQNPYSMGWPTFAQHKSIFSNPSRDAGTGVHYGALSPLTFEGGVNRGKGALA